MRSLALASLALIAPASAQTAYVLPCSNTNQVIYEADFGAGTVTALFDGGVYFFDAACNGIGTTFYASSLQGGLYLVDIDAQAVFQIAQTGSAANTLAFDPGTGTLYGSDYDNLYTIDTASGVATLLGALGAGSMYGMTYDVVRSRLVGCNQQGFVYTINTTTGAATALGWSGVTNNTDLWVEPTTGRMFGTNAWPSDLIELDPLTGQATFIASTTLTLCSIGVTGAETAGFGQTYCAPGALNSTGQSGRIGISGSPVAAANQLILSAFDLPPNQFGYFLVSSVQDFVPNAGGSQGTLCLGLPIGRYAAQVQSSGPNGALAIQPDLTALPLTPPVAVQAGETWNFQAWYRDQNPGATSNFTDAVAVTFQ